MDKTRIHAPEFPCGECNTYDWNWNETMNHWECRSCAVNGRPEPEKPTINPMQADEWTERMLKEYDEAVLQLENDKEAPQDGQAMTIMRIARINRSEKKLKLAAIRADAASLIQQLQNETTEGDIYINLPEVDLKIRLQW